MKRNEAVWTAEHADFVAELDKQNKTTPEISVAMSKHFKMRITPGQVQRLMSKMRSPQNELYRNLPYRVSGARTIRY